MYIHGMVIMSHLHYILSIFEPCGRCTDIACTDLLATGTINTGVSHLSFHALELQRQVTSVYKTLSQYYQPLYSPKQHVTKPCVQAQGNTKATRVHELSLCAWTFIITNLSTRHCFESLVESCEQMIFQRWTQ